jgi:hypothetical protein
MICIPCQLGGKEYKGYGQTPFQSNVPSNGLMVYNDWKNAFQNKGKEKQRYLPFDSVASGNLHPIYDMSISFQKFLDLDLQEGQLLLMNYQEASKKTVNKQKNPKRFYVAQVPIQGFSRNKLQVKGTVACSSGLSWTGLKPCDVKLNIQNKNVSFTSTALSMSNIPFEAIRVKVNLSVALKVNDSNLKF